MSQSGLKLHDLSSMEFIKSRNRKQQDKDREIIEDLNMSPPFQHLQ